MDSINQRVAAGAEFLDTHHPGWAARINLEQLDMANSCRCILGQMFSPTNNPTGNLAMGWFAVLTAAGLRGYTVEDLGFVAGLGGSDEDDEQEYALLEEAWISLLKDRFSRGDV